jgi:glycosyltransferase involved in cell wall biosynthesis
VIGDAGLIFPEGDAEALAHALGRLRCEAGLRRSLIEKGYERVQRVYHHDVIMRRTVQFYRELLDARRALPPLKESIHAPQR